MFTGIVQAVGRIVVIEELGGDARLRIAASDLGLEHAGLGDSIAVNGVCLTVVDVTQTEFAADVSQETLSLTTLRPVCSRIVSPLTAKTSSMVCSSSNL